MNARLLTARTNRLRRNKEFKIFNIKFLYTPLVNSHTKKNACTVVAMMMLLRNTNLPDVKENKIVTMSRTSKVTPVQ